MSNWSATTGGVKNEHVGSAKKMQNKKVDGVQDTGAKQKTANISHEFKGSEANIKQTKGDHHQITFGNSQNSTINTQQDGKKRNITSITGNGNVIGSTMENGKATWSVDGNNNHGNLDAENSEKLTAAIYGDGFTSDHLTLSSSGVNKLALVGDDFDIADITAGDADDKIKLKGDDGNVDSIDLAGGDDTITVSGEDVTVGNLDGGDGDDTARLNGVEANVENVENAVIRQTKGENKLTFDEALKNLNFDGIDFNADDWALDGSTLKHTDGSEYSFAGTDELNVKFGDEEKLFADWFGANVDPDDDDDTTTTGDVITQDDIEGPLTGANEVDVNNFKLEDLDLKQGDDILRDIDKDASGSVDGGAGNDIAEFLNNVEDYTITGNETDGFTFQHNDSDESLLLNNFEGFNFNGTSLDVSGLQNHIAPTFDDDANTYTAQENATSAHANIDLAGGDDSFVVGANGAAGYESIIGGAGNDTLDLTALDQAQLESLFSANVNGAGTYSNFQLGGASIDGFENIQTGIDDGSGNGTNFSFASFQEFFQWLLG